MRDMGRFCVWSKTLLSFLPLSQWRCWCCGGGRQMKTWVTPWHSLVEWTTDCGCSVALTHQGEGGRHRPLYIFHFSLALKIWFIHRFSNSREGDAIVVNAFESGLINYSLFEAFRWPVTLGQFLAHFILLAYLHAKHANTYWLNKEL